MNEPKRPASDAEWYCRKDPEADRFYEILQQKIKQSTFVKAENDQVLDVRGTH